VRVVDVNSTARDWANGSWRAAAPMPMTYTKRATMVNRGPTNREAAMGICNIQTMASSPDRKPPEYTWVNRTIGMTDITAIEKTGCHNRGRHKIRTAAEIMKIIQPAYIALTVVLPRDRFRMIFRMVRAPPANIKDVDIVF
jgi:hypothetical protein